MATIVKTPNGSWKAVIRRQGWPITSKTFRLRRDAVDWARTAEDEMVRGVFVNRAEPARLTLKSALERYLKEVTSQKKTSTRKKEEAIAKQLIKALGQYSLASLDAKRISEYREERLADHAPDTVRLELIMLGSLFNVAIKEWQVGLVSNPAKLVKKPTGIVRDRLLTWSEIKRLLKSAKQDSQPLVLHAIRLAMFTAMRHSEITHLRVQDIDFNKRLAFVVGKTIGSRQKQAVPLSARACRTLKAAIACPARTRNSQLIFSVTSDKPYDLKAGWGRVVKRAGLEDVRIHDLRHLATTIYAKRGLTTQQLQQLTRHKTLSMLNRYSHLQASDIVDLL